MEERWLLDELRDDGPKKVITDEVSTGNPFLVLVREYVITFKHAYSVTFYLLLLIFYLLAVTANTSTI